MPTSFHGWRRKLGVGTLGMACLFMAGWLRSLTHVEILNLYRDDTSFRTIVSNWGRLSLIGSNRPVRITATDLDVIEGAVGMISVEFRDGHDLYERLSIAGPDLDLIYGGDLACEFTFHGPAVHARGTSTPTWTIPYWSAVLPLTLISFWLLITKPR